MANTSLEKMIGRQPSVQEKHETQLEEARKEIKGMLPPVVRCVLGTVPYEQFKEHYSEIYKQVEEMQHLLVGRVTFSGKLGETEYTIRSLKQGEVVFLNSFLPNSLDDTGNGLEKYNLYRLLLSVEKFGKVAFKCPAITMKTSAEEWEAAAEAQIEMVANFDETLVNVLNNLANDISQAKGFAFMELLPDPSDPHEQ